MAGQSRFLAAAGMVLCAAFVLTFLGNSQSFAITVTAAVGGSSTTCNSPGGTLQTGTTPVAASVTCFTTTAGFESAGTASASASAGHVGATADATTAGGAAGIHMTGTAVYTDVFIFHSTNAISGTLASLNLGGIGSMAAGGLFATSSVDLRVFIGSITNPVGEIHSSLDMLGNKSCTSSFGSGGCSSSLFATGPLVTSVVSVPLDQPVFFRLRLDVDVTANAALSAASALFGNSFDFPIGVALFNLEPGVTVNAPDSFVTDNIFAPPTSVTPVPAALPLFATGLGVLGLLGWRRRQNSA